MACVVEGRGRERFKADAARAALVVAGIEMLVERGVVPGLARVTLKDAIERSGVPRTTAYRVFAGEAGSLALFHEALIAQLDVSADVDVSLDLVAAMLDRNAPILESGDPEAKADLLREMIRVGFNSRVRVLMGQAEWRAYVSSVAGFEGDYPTSPRRGPEYRFGAMFEMLGGVFGFRPMPPLTWVGFGKLLMSALDGAALRTLVDPTFDDFSRPGEGHDPEARWNGVSIIAEALFLVWCEPDLNVENRADLSRWTAFA